MRNFKITVSQPYYIISDGIRLAKNRSGDATDFALRLSSTFPCGFFIIPTLFAKMDAGSKGGIHRPMVGGSNIRGAAIGQHLRPFIRFEKYAIGPGWYPSPMRGIVVIWSVRNDNKSNERAPMSYVPFAKIMNNDL